MRNLPFYDMLASAVPCPIPGNLDLRGSADTPEQRTGESGQQQLPRVTGASNIFLQPTTKGGRPGPLPHPKESVCNHPACKLACSLACQKTCTAQNAGFNCRLD